MNAGLFIAIFIFLGIIALFIQATFLLWGAKLAGIPGRSFGKAIGILILSAVAGALLSMLPGGAVGGTLIGLLINSLIMMALFSTSFLRALAATVIALALGVLVIGGLALLIGALVGGFSAFAL